MKLVWHPASQPAFRTFFSKGQGKPVQFTRIKCSSMHLSNTARKCPLYQHTLLVVELWLKLSFRWVDRAALHHFCIVFHLHTGAAVHLPFWTLVPLCPVNRTKTFFNRFAPLLLPQSPQLCKHPLIACKLSKAQQIPFCVELKFLPCTVRSSFLFSDKKGAQLSEPCHSPKNFSVSELHRTWSEQTRNMWGWGALCSECSSLCWPGKRVKASECSEQMRNQGWKKSVSVGPGWEGGN